MITPIGSDDFLKEAKSFTNIIKFNPNFDGKNVVIEQGGNYWRPILNKILRC